jgi:hypothetical protein
MKKHTQYFGKIRVKISWKYLFQNITKNNTLLLSVSHCPNKPFLNILGKKAIENISLPIFEIKNIKFDIFHGISSLIYNMFTYLIELC